MTVKDKAGKEVFFKRKEYAVYEFHFAENKEGYLGLDSWDITSMEHIDLGLEPKKTDSNIYVIPLAEGTSSVEVEAAFRFLYEEGKSAVINKVNKKVEF